MEDNNPITIPITYGEEEPPKWEETEPVVGLEDQPPSWENTQPVEETPSWEQTEPTEDTKKTGWFEEFRFGFKEQESDVQNLGIILESKFPLQHHFTDASAEEEAEYLALTPDERREFILQERNKELQQDFPELYGAGEQSGWTTAGNIVGAITSPTTLAPIGQTYKAIAGIGALLGFEFSVADQYAQEGEVELERTVRDTLIGTVAAPATVAAGRGLVKTYQAAANKGNKRKVKEATKLSQEAEVAMNRAANEGVPIKDIPLYVQKATGKTREELVEAASVSGYKPKLLSKDERKFVDQVQRNNGIDVTSRGSNSFVDQFLGVLSTRIGMISQSLKAKLRKFDMDTHIKTHEAVDIIKPFKRTFKNLPQESKKAISRMLYNGDFKQAEEILANASKDGVEQFRNITKLLDDIYKNLKAAGYSDLKKLPNYFPRTIKDLDGLLNAVGKERKSIINRALNERKSQLRVDKLPVEEESRIINNVLRGYSPKINNSGLSYTKSRSIQRIDDELMQYYEDPLTSLYNYVQSTSNNIGKRKFFGQNASVIGEDTVDIDESINNLIRNELKELSPEDAETLQTLLNARFVNGEKGASQIVQGLRNAGYATTLANPLSAITQAGDIAVSAYAHGIANTVRAIVSPDKRINMEDFGLYDVIAEEFTNEVFMAKWLHNLFRASGFAQIDKLGKNISLRASFNKGRGLAKSEKGVAKLRKKYGGALGPEFNNMVDDLRAGNITPNTKLYLWSELADVQPLSLSEQTQKYLETPNGRIWYSLKTWMLKQLDVLRRDIKHEWDNGSKATAIKKGISYSLLVPTANMGVQEAKDFLVSGETSDVDKYPEEYFYNVFKVFGGSEYIQDRYLSRGDLPGAAMNIIAPPLGYISSVGNAVLKTAEGDYEGASDELLKEMPLIGRFWYYWMGDGLESLEERRED